MLRGDDGSDSRIDYMAVPVLERQFTKKYSFTKIETCNHVCILRSKGLSCLVKMNELSERSKDTPDGLRIRLAVYIPILYHTVILAFLKFR